jgi:2-C-methyl-D-erythritol 4-phosphate cytidylyltransferase
MLGVERLRRQFPQPSALMLTAIIVAGGSSQRMGFDKLFAPLNGRPVVAHSIAAFENTASVHDIILVGRADRLSDYEEIVRLQGFGKISAVIPGGARRQDSVQKGWSDWRKIVTSSRCTMPPDRSLGRQ